MCRNLLKLKKFLMTSSIKPGLHISRKDGKHMVANTFLKLFTYALVFT